VLLNAWMFQALGCSSSLQVLAVAAQSNVVPKCFLKDLESFDSFPCVFEICRKVVVRFVAHRSVHLHVGMQNMTCCAVEGWAVLVHVLI
jgi:hypothetical protein